MKVFWDEDEDESNDKSKSSLKDELEKEDATIIRIDYKDSGIGSNSCGPELMHKYRFEEKKVENFTFYIG